jgi:signal transduction histidine kinase
MRCRHAGQASQTDERPRQNDQRKKFEDPMLTKQFATPSSGLVTTKASRYGQGVSGPKLLPGAQLGAAIATSDVSLAPVPGDDAVPRRWWQKCAASIEALATGLGKYRLKRPQQTILEQQQAIQELRASEKQLQRQNSLLQLSLENMGEGLSVFDRQGRLVAFNSRFAELLELPSELLAETSLYKILEFQTARGDFAAAEKSIGVQERFERMFCDLPAMHERVTAAGRTLQIRRQAMPGGIVSLYSDITERKAAELRMVQARTQAELANNAKTNFLANMSHELRTPMNAIIGFAEVVSNEILGPMTDKKYLEYVKDIHSSGLHLLSIINDVLDMAKIEAGKFDLANAPLSISQVVADAVRMVREQAHQHDIELVATLPHEEVTLVGDERAIKQALLNILSNAVKFSKPGGQVDIRVRQDDMQGVTLEVEDHGIGMSKDVMVRALQPFEQADSSTARVYGGTGLGLPIAKGLAEAQGGTLTLESCEDRGTRVRIVLPTQQKAGRPAGADQTRTVHSDGRSSDVS